jgi:hypothetical protein
MEKVNKALDKEISLMKIKTTQAENNAKVDK